MKPLSVPPAPGSSPVQLEPCPIQLVPHVLITSSSAHRREHAPVCPPVEDDKDDGVIPALE